MSRFLRFIHAERYGGLDDCSVGPFGPGLNVVYGPNEAGKSTLASLVGGVLFGWEDAHGVRNTYRPYGEAVRAGRLTWAEDAPGIPDAGELARDESVATGDTSVLDDIDRETYDAVFSLKVDELNALRNSSDVTARLITAVSGSGTSPARAFVQIEQRIAALTAPADGDMPHDARGASEEAVSVFELQRQLEAKREEMKVAAERTALLLQEDRELHELEAGRADAAERVEALNDELEDLISWRTELAATDEQIDRRLEERKALMEELASAAGAPDAECSVDPRLLALDSAGERVLRDKLDEFAESHEKVTRAVDTAKENSASSTAAYEALCELDADEVAASRRLRNRPSQAAVSVLLPLAFIVAGVPVFVHGRQIGSLSIGALGVSLVVMAMFLAAAAFFLLFRRPDGADALDERRQDAQWVMLQDRKKLEASLAEKEEVEGQISRCLEESGLGAADGSVRQARSLLDEARAVRAERVEADQRAASLQLRVHATDDELAELRAARSRLEAAAGLRSQASPDAESRSARTAQLRELEAKVRERSAQRDALLEAGEDMGQRFGELNRELRHARDDRALDRAGFEYQQLRTRLRAAKGELISLLLAKRLLERSIAEWERRGQPEVYDSAGALLSLITDGAWVGVSTSATGSLVAEGADGRQVDPRHLSLGTCQQLYLALRIALLKEADEVGRCTPVLADDVLVNFDASRRTGAARALARLAEQRQVIVFTCHRSTVEALLAQAAGAVLVEL